MTGDRTEQALARLERAAQRIEQAATRTGATLADETRRNAGLRQAISETLRELDQMISGNPGG